MSDQVIAIRRNGAVSDLPHQRKVRLLLWGGAAKPGDNSAFDFAARNVGKNYQALDNAQVVVVPQRVLVAKDIVRTINESEDDDIQSLDLFTHGGPEALYLTTASPDTRKLARRFLHNASLYRTRAKMIFNWAAWTGGAALVGDIDFAKFTVNAKIELHGCKGAISNASTDNIASDLSLRLYAAGKRSAVVIGHADGANPNINGGGEKLDEQDYRHGERVVLHNGTIIKVTKQKGHLDERELERLASGGLLA
jgi:hypothetical protein